MYRIPLFVLSAGCAFVAAGCDTKVHDTYVEVSKSAGESNSPATGIELQVVDEKEFAAVVAKHKGKVVLVDFWATWCGPCVEGFPHTVEMYKKHQDRGLAAVSLSFDDPDDQPKVRAFLESQGAAFDNLLSKYGTALVEAADAFDFDGSLPHYRLYDRAGKLRHSWSPESAKPAELEQKIEELLAEK